jgi:hypothetical protein
MSCVDGCTKQYAIAVKTVRSKNGRVSSYDSVDKHESRNYSRKWIISRLRCRETYREVMCGI